MRVLDNFATGQRRYLDGLDIELIEGQQTRDFIYMVGLAETWAWFQSKKNVRRM